MSLAFREFKQRVVLYADDWWCGLRDKRSISATFLLYFATLGPAITFAFYLEERTGGSIGVVEVLLSTALCGVFFAIFGGQPLVIVGVTGPVTVFYETLYQIGVNQLQLPFLPLVACVSFWGGAILFILGSFGAPTVVKYVTRFSDEIFGLLVAVLFLQSAVTEFNKQFDDAELDAALLSLMLGLGTFALAMALQNARQWRFLRSWLRGAIADYGTVFSIVFFSACALLPRLQEADAPRLDVPNRFQPTVPRAWVVDFEGFPTWAVFASIIPGSMIAILFFLDHNISVRLSQDAIFGLKKPTAYNYDTILLGLAMCIVGVFGLPACNCLIPQAPLHVRALAKIRKVEDARVSETDLGRAARAAGQREVWLSVTETRIAALAQSILLAVTLAPPFLYLLSWVRRGVLAGFFLVMAFASFPGSALVERTMLLCTDRSLVSAYYSAPYVELPIRVIGSFICVQHACVALIFALTFTPASMGFPVLIGLLVPLRLFVITRFFSSDALKLLDPFDSDGTTAAGDRATGPVAAYGPESRLALTVAEQFVMEDVVIDDSRTLRL